MSFVSLLHVVRSPGQGSRWAKASSGGMETIGFEKRAVEREAGRSGARTGLVGSSEERGGHTEKLHLAEGWAGCPSLVLKAGVSLSPFLAEKEENPLILFSWGLLAPRSQCDPTASL